ncbi:MAG TPA: hypothetical protein VHL55_01175 [Acidimicrobiia bacterium]|jgi:hypothetical protein|nr:hypothetical protein [Acidimicrobiia bacterium]
MDAKPDEVEPDPLDDLEEALERLESVDAAEAPPLARDIGDRLARALDSTEAP